MSMILIASCAGKRQIIGDHGTLPWHFSSDLKFFKATTKGQTILMGRKTYDAIMTQFGRPLPDRRHLIVSRDPTWRPAVGEVFPDIDSALMAAPPQDDLYVVGGAQIYEQTLPRAQKVLLTHIDQEYPGDAFFPALAPETWRLADTRQEMENGTRLRFCTYIRV
ncbi:MAG: dihydrofolate reductase [Alphaproteobacteria bacterium]